MFHLTRLTQNEATITCDLDPAASYGDKRCKASWHESNPPLARVFEVLFNKKLAEMAVDATEPKGMHLKGPRFTFRIRVMVMTRSSSPHVATSGPLPKWLGIFEIGQACFSMPKQD